MSQHTRLEINITNENANILKYWANKYDTSTTQLIHEAIKYIDKLLMYQESGHPVTINFEAAGDQVRKERNRKEMSNARR